MAAAALPAAITAAKVGGTALAGHFLAKKLGKPPGLTPQGQQAQNGLMGNATALQGAGQGLLGAGAGMRDAGMAEFRKGAPDLDAASGYLRSLVSGSPGATAAAVAPQIGQITSIYRGAESGLDRSGVRGAARDVATAEMGREKAGRISDLVLSQRPGAVAGLAQLAQGRQQTGLNLSGQGLQATAGGIGALQAASGPLGTIYGGEARRAEQGAANQAEIGKFFANIIFDMMRGQGGGGRPEMSRISRAGFGV